MNWDDEIERLIKSDFFFKMGENEQIDHVIFIKNVNEAFINPTEEAFAGMYKEVQWLPSALTDADPFYKNIQIPENLLPYRKEIVQFFLKEHRNLNKKLFSFGPYDFTEVDLELSDQDREAVEIGTCNHQKEELEAVARSIRKRLYEGARYKDIRVLLGDVDAYQLQLKTIFDQYQIPFYLGKSESMAQHPLVQWVEY